MSPPLSRRQFAALLLAATPAALRAQTPSAAPAAGRKIDLQIGEDFKAGEADIRAVLTSAAGSIWQHCPNTRWEEPGFYIYHCNDCPITLFDHRADGRIAIGLTTQGNYWSQFAFQFAHEFCHALAGHSNDWKKLLTKERKANHWLEESVCETASLFALRAMGTTWKTAPPYPNWKPYANSLTGYAADRIAKAGTSQPADKSFKDWFHENEPAMRANPVLRDNNNIVANHLLPVFEAEPSGWEAMTSFNLGKRNPENTLAAHFADWSAAAPATQRAFIGKVAAVFGR